MTRPGRLSNGSEKRCLRALRGWPPRWSLGLGGPIRPPHWRSGSSAPTSHSLRTTCSGLANCSPRQADRPRPSRPLSALSSRMQPACPAGCHSSPASSKAVTARRLSGRLSGWTSSSPLPLDRWGWPGGRHCWDAPRTRSAPCAKRSSTSPRKSICGSVWRNGWLVAAGRRRRARFFRIFSPPAAARLPKGRRRQPAERSPI